MNVKVTATWDTIIVGEQTIDVEEMNLDKWSRLVIRLDPVLHSGERRFLHTQDDPAVGGYREQLLRLYEQTLLKVEFERVDSLGRKLSR